MDRSVKAREALKKGRVAPGPHFPVAPALIVSVAPATPTAAGRGGPHLHVRILSGPARLQARFPGPPPPFPPVPGWRSKRHAAR